MYDAIVKNGSVIDGTGAPARVAGIGIRDGRVAAVGDLDESGRVVIDADGLTVAPGFIDLHSHYDAQVFWDTTLTPSCLHGVTTVVGGQLRAHPRAGLDHGSGFPDPVARAGGGHPGRGAAGGRGVHMELLRRVP